VTRKIAVPTPPCGGNGAALTNRTGVQRICSSMGKSQMQDKGKSRFFSMRLLGKTAGRETPR
jgi:hypothetical protein